MRGYFLFTIPLIAILTSCSNADKPVLSNAVEHAPKVSPSAKSAHKTNFNCDTLEKIFSGSPYEFTFGDEKALSKTTEAHLEGEEHKFQSKGDADFQNSVIINYDKNTRAVRNIVFYINRARTDVKPLQLKKLVEILDYFDPKASKYVMKNFDALFYDLNAYEALEPYDNEALGLKMTIIQSLFDSRRFVQKQASSASDQDYIAVTVTFN